VNVQNRIQLKLYPTEEDAKDLNHLETPGLSLRKVVERMEWLTRIANCYIKTVHEYQHKY
jgi:hypothetical protein